MSAIRRFETSLKRLNCADIVEKRGFSRQSQFRRPLAVLMEISLGAQRSDPSLCVRPSLRPCCGNYLWRQRYPRRSGILVAPQFPTFSTISANSGHSPRWLAMAQLDPLLAFKGDTTEPPHRDAAHSAPSRNMRSLFRGRRHSAAQHEPRYRADFRGRGRRHDAITGMVPPAVAEEILSRH